MRRKHKALVAAAALGALGLGVVGYNEYSLQRAEQNFPAIVQDFERTYGKFPKELRVERQEFEWDIAGQAQNDGVIGINKSASAAILSAYVLGTREDLLRHEVAHFVVREMLYGAKSNWLVRRGDKIEGLDVTWWRQNEMLIEGSAEYIARKLGGRPNEVYEKEFQFMKPLIETAGLKKALRFVAEHPPTNDETMQPEAYYSRIGVEKNTEATK